MRFPPFPTPQQALALRDSDMEASVTLLGEVLELRNRAYGFEALECADTYRYYGMCIFESAQVSAAAAVGDLVGGGLTQRWHSTAQQGPTAAQSLGAASCRAGCVPCTSVGLLPPRHHQRAPISTCRTRHTQAHESARPATTDSATSAPQHQIQIQVPQMRV